MSDQPSLGLCCGSLIQADFRGLVEAASAAGFGSISLWPTLFQNALDAGLNEQDIHRIIINGFKAAFLPFHQKQTMVRAVSRELSSGAPASEPLVSHRVDADA